MTACRSWRADEGIKDSSLRGKLSDRASVVIGNSHWFPITWTQTLCRAPTVEPPIVPPHTVRGQARRERSKVKEQLSDLAVNVLWRSVAVKLVDFSFSVVIVHDWHAGL